jgi:ribonuclease VapC
VFVDASAAVAALTGESDGELIARKAFNSPIVLFSAMAYYETCLGMARAIQIDPELAETKVQHFLKYIQATTVAINAEMGVAAVRAHIRFGKGRHKAGLNMGDCFAYACAKVHKVPLLCKGNDFIHTDIELA